MKALVQRVLSAQVHVEEELTGAIGPGLLVFLGVEKGDTENEAIYLANRTVHLRVFSDDAGRFNRSLKDELGSVLVVSQFTLMADTRRGHRPSFTDAAPPEVAAPLVDCYADALRVKAEKVATGRFGAHMRVSLENDGPVTILLESKKRE